jgi:hypothetical protein
MNGALRDMAALTALLPKPHLYARSAKITSLGVSENRSLYTIARRSFGPQSNRRFLEAAEACLNYPPDELRPWLNHCNIFHFGFEVGLDRNVRKVYLELTGETPEDPGLTYVALKASDGPPRLNYYRTVQMTKSHNADLLLGSIGLNSDVYSWARPIATAICETPGETSTLLVTEKGSGRRSLDFNFSDDGASPSVLSAITSFLYFLGQKPDAIDRLLTPALCHAALGTSGEGLAFVTLYSFPERIDA